jgi:hypothetical protein
MFASVYDCIRSDAPFCRLSGQQQRNGGPELKSCAAFDPSRKLPSGIFALLESSMQRARALSPPYRLLTVIDYLMG